jgi:hypothetical protein
MKDIIMLTVIGAGCFVPGACQDRPHPDYFGQKTHRAYNPKTA